MVTYKKIKIKNFGNGWAWGAAGVPGGGVCDGVPDAYLNKPN